MAFSKSASGNLLIITDFIRNNGNQDTGPFQVFYYLSHNRQIAQSDLLIGQRLINNLAPGELSTAQSRFSIDRLPAGTFILGAMIDPDNRVAESNENNNTRAESFNTIIGSDVRPSSFQPNLSGGKISVQGSAVNQGNQAADAFSMGYYLSRDNTITPSDFLIGQQGFSGLAYNGIEPISGSFDIPEEIPSEIYFIGAIADADNNLLERIESNNAVVTTSTFQIKPDLSFTSSMPVSLSGTSFFVTTTVINNGNRHVPTSTAITVNIYVSPDNIIETTDTFLCSRTFNGLLVNTTNTATLTCSHLGVAPGTYFVGAIVDPDNTIVEINESANSRVSTQAFKIGPNLRPTSVTFTKSGSNLILSDTIQNNGNQPAATILVHYFLSTDNTITTADTFLCSRTITNIGPLLSNAASTTCSLGGVSPGTYFVGVIVDPNDTILESDETDNALSSASSVVVP